MTEYTDFHAPGGLRTRGTVLVVPGRGETRATYTRLGRRLAADAYRVRVIDAPDLGADDLSGALTLFGDRLAGAAEDAAGDEDGFVRPLVTAGEDGTLTVAPGTAEALAQVTDAFSRVLGGRTTVLAAAG